jgi:hypothetical protein
MLRKNVMMIMVMVVILVVVMGGSGVAMAGVMREERGVVCTVVGALPVLQLVCHLIVCA